MARIATSVMTVVMAGVLATGAAAQPTPAHNRKPAPPALQGIVPLPPLPDLGALQAEVARAKAELERARVGVGVEGLGVDVELAVRQAYDARARANVAGALTQGLGQAVRGGVAGGVGEGVGQGAEREADLYESGYSALSEGRWERALDRFTRVIEMKGARADRAMYWKAYAQDKLNQSAEALTTIGELRRVYSSSRYLPDAKALEVEIRERAGQPARPENQDDEELKLLALRALQNSDPEQAVPMLEKFLKGHDSPRLKERALFVLAQSESTRARQVLAAVAKGEYSPDLQLKALQYLGYARSAENRALLADIYKASSDVDVKRRILRAFMTLDDRDRLLEVARTEPSRELRIEAVRQLGMMKASDALWELYQKETSTDVKQQILRGFSMGGSPDRLIDLAKAEQNPDLKKTAVRSLGLLPAEKSGAALTSIYDSDVSDDVRKAALQSLFIQHNDVALVALARKEKNPELKKDIVQRLSTMKSKVALDYLMEILSK